jgi:hypothetical protein
MRIPGYRWEAFLFWVALCFRSEGTPVISTAFMMLERFVHGDDFFEIDDGSLAKVARADEEDSDENDGDDKCCSGSPHLYMPYSAALWRWVGLEMLTARRPDTGCTLLHAAACNNNGMAVRELTHVWMNPLLRDHNGRLAVELTTDSNIREMLLRYVAQPTQLEMMRWYGPYVVQRVHVSARHAALV